MLEQIASLHEIEAHWTIADVLDANEALDVQSDVTAWRTRQRKSEQDTKIAREAAMRALTGGR